MAHLLVVDDEKSICEMLDIALRKQGHRVETVTSLEMAHRRLLSNIYDIVITDIKLPQGSGLDVLQHVRETQPETLVILVTAYASVDSAVQALNLGAFRYIIKTPNLVDEVRVTVARGVEDRSLRQENRALKRELRKSLDSLLGVSPPIKALKGVGGHRRPHQQHHPDHRRERHRQGTGGPRHSRRQRPLGPPVCLGQLRRLPRNTARERDVRLRQRRLHRSHHQ